MFAIMPTPLFNHKSHPHPPSSPTRPSQSLYRPAVSSPLSSSPIRAFDDEQGISSNGSHNLNAFRLSQSSPIRAPPLPLAPALLVGGSGSGSGKFLRYADRDARPNPLVRRREDVQEGRRKLFLKNVRQRADDKRWEMRGGENELLKLEWNRLNRELCARRNREAEDLIRDADIESEMEALERETARLRRAEAEAQAGQQQRAGMNVHMNTNTAMVDAPATTADLDDMMLDAMEQEEEAEIDALVSSMPQVQAQVDDARLAHHLRPDSPQFGDEEDEDFDALFTDLLAQQGPDNGMVMSQEDVEMT